MEFIELFLNFSSGVLDTAIVSYREGDMHIAGAFVGGLVSAWVATIYLIVMLVLGLKIYLLSEDWGMTLEDAFYLILACPLLVIALSGFLGWVLGALLNVIIFVVPYLVPLVDIFLEVGSVVVGLFCLRWVISLKKGLLVHTMDKGVHVDNGSKLEKTGLHRTFTKSEYETAAMILQQEAMGRGDASYLAPETMHRGEMYRGKSGTVE